MAKLHHVAVALSLFLLLALIPLPLLGPITPKIPNARAATVGILLRGFTNTGWNGSTNPNPTITVHAFDAVRLTLGTADTASHQFLLDGNRDGSGTADCLNPDPCSPVVPPSTIYPFSVSSIPAGTYTYYCTFHPTTMFGSFVIAPDFALSSSPSTLNVPAGSFGTSQITLNNNGFSGTISLSSSISPTTSSMAGTLKPASVTLSPGVSGSSTLNVTTTSFTQLGIYSVNVTGTSGGLSRSTLVTVNVTSGTIGGNASLHDLHSPFIALATIVTATIALAGIYIKRVRAAKILKD